jgi:hypothetical protein
MAWEKLGLIHCLPESENRSTTHMQGPVALEMDGIIRIYYAARNKNGKSYPSYIDVDAANPLELINVHDEPIMHHGPVGAFDDEGNMPACAIRIDDEIWMYYSGWNRRVTVPYHNTTGIGVSLDGGSYFDRKFDGPVLERTPIEAYMAVTPYVIRDKTLWKMWYVSGLGWQEVEGKQEPVYVIKYASSVDGINWMRSGDIVIPQKDPLEAMARPTVLQRNSLYHMWFSYRSSHDFRDGEGSYRVGYARSLDGVKWKREDSLAGVDVSPDGWDSRMVCYPYVLEVSDRLLMFYNGNSFGQSGIGCAVWNGPLPDNDGLQDLLVSDSG